MNNREKEKARSNVAASERECGALNGMTLHCDHEQYKPKAIKRQGQMVSHFLKCGEENARSTEELKAILHCDTRRLRQKVANERAMGIPIITRAQGGYYLPSEGEKGREEIERSKAFIMAKAVGAIRTANNLPNQTVIDGQERIEEV